MAMAESHLGSPSIVQPDHDDSIQHFLAWTKSSDTYRIGCGGPNNDIDHRFIPWETLRVRLNRARINQLLEALFKGQDTLKPDAERIREHYLRPFAILLCIGEGRMISQFQKQQSLEDHRLPFRSEPYRFPVSSTRDDFYSAFHREQWAFCPIKLTYLMGSDLGKDDILPIISKREMGEGGSSKTSKVSVHEDYDELVPQHSDDEHSDLQGPPQHIYVIKTYRGPKAKDYFETERDAFLQLNGKRKPPMNIIRFYGSFVQEETCNIILEHADLGDLERYMKESSPPSSADDRLLFWESFLEVTNGLFIIHGESENNANIPMLLGWHHDVHPGNILVQTRKGGKNIYDCDFKLADLGLSHFKMHSRRDATDVEPFGTTAYGAPETRRPGANMMQSDLNVKQEAEIWSLGCVFSEVATWVDQGWNKVQEYRFHRSDEVEEKTGQREDCFHSDFDDLLDSVKEIHSEIEQSRRANDHVTHRVVNELVREMLQPTDPRPSARVLYFKSKRIVNDAKKEKNSISNGVLVDQRNSPLKLPPKLPAGHRLGIPPQSPPVQVQPSSPTPRTPRSSSFAQEEGRDPRGYTETLQASDSMFRNRPSSYRGETLNAGSSHSPREQWEVQGSSFDPDQGTIYRPSLDCLVKGNGSAPLFMKSQPTSPPEFDPEDISRYNTNVSEWAENHQRRVTPRFSSQGSTNSASYATREESFQNPANKRTSASTGLKIITTETNGKNNKVESYKDSVAARHKASGEGQKRPPTMSVEEGLALMKTREFSKYVRFPHEELFKSLAKRDHVFFIDNAESMAPYCARVRNVLSLLWYMVAPADPDGVDLYFSTEDKKWKPRNHYETVDYLDKRPPHGIPDIRYQFASILESHQNQFGKRNWFSKLRHLPPKGPRKMSLYVLTDGVWQPNTDLETEIRTLVQNLVRHGLTNKQIGIQFIRFGRNPERVTRLRKLDSELHLDLDVVDTTPADGNVWKMLLGPINDWFDRDDEGE